MSITARSFQPRRSVRVLTCVASPFCPGEVHELAAVDVMVDGDGARFEGVEYKTFPVADGDAGHGGTTCTSLQVAACVWGGRPPDVLVSHDAATASLVFTDEITCGVPWVSLHKVGRRVWPGQHAYDLNQLARWRAWPGCRGSFLSTLPSGAARDAEFTARLLVELLDDPGLIDVAQAAFLDRVDREASGTGAGFGGWNALDAALSLSSLPSKPLREPPFPFDDQSEWAGIGTEDLRHFARFGDDDFVVDAARAVLQMRRLGKGGGLVVRRSQAPGETSGG